METLNERIENLEKRTTNLEQQNVQLKSEKAELQNQVEQLLSILSQVKSGSGDVDLHKRFKISEIEEQFVQRNYSGTTDDKQRHSSESSPFSCEGEESEFLSSGEDNSGIMKTENWLNQNDILSQVINGCNNKHSSSTHIHEEEVWLPLEKIEMEQTDRFILHRGNKDDMYDSIFEENNGGILSQAFALTLTVVMWLVLWFNTAEFAEKGGYRDYHAIAPGARTKMSTNYFETDSSFHLYLRIILITTFILVTIFLKWGGWLKRLSFNPSHSPRKVVK